MTRAAESVRARFSVLVEEQANEAALQAASGSITWGELDLRSDEVAAAAGRVEGRPVVAIDSDSRYEQLLVGLVSGAKCESQGRAPLITALPPATLDLLATGLATVAPGIGVGTLAPDLVDELDGDLGFLLPTSGTTAAPKLVAHTWSSAVESFWLTYTAGGFPTVGKDLHALPPPSGARLCSLFPVGTVSAVVIALRALLAGETLIDIGTAGGEPDWLLLDALGAHSLGLDPFSASRLLRHCGGEGMRPAKSLAWVAMGGARPEPALCEALEMELDVLVGGGYGATEIFGAAFASGLGHSRQARHETIGSVLDGVSYEVRSCGDEGSELWVKSPALGRGQLDLHSRTFTPFYATGWWASGDLVVESRPGEVRVVGRVGGQLSRGGRTIAPEVVERELMGLDGVADACVVQLDRGPVVALVQRREGTVQPSNATLRQAASGAGDGGFAPTGISWTDLDLPRTPTGKLRRWEVRTMLTDEERWAMPSASRTSDVWQ